MKANAALQGSLLLFSCALSFYNVRRNHHGLISRAVRRELVPAPKARNAAVQIRSSALSGDAHVRSISKRSVRNPLCGLPCFAGNAVKLSLPGFAPRGAICVRVYPDEVLSLLCQVLYHRRLCFVSDVQLRYQAQVDIPLPVIGSRLQLYDAIELFPDETVIARKINLCRSLHVVGKRVLG